MPNYHFFPFQASYPPYFLPVKYGDMNSKMSCKPLWQAFSFAHQKAQKQVSTPQRPVGADFCQITAMLYANREVAETEVTSTTGLPPPTLHNSGAWLLNYLLTGQHFNI